MLPTCLDRAVVDIETHVTPASGSDANGTATEGLWAHRRARAAIFEIQRRVRHMRNV